MLDAVLGAAGNLADPHHLAWLLLGVFIGFWVGIIPGIGGMVGIAIVLPFLFGMDPVSGIFVLIGIVAVNNTSDSFPAVIFGIPGGASSVATIMDGHPLARQGQAGRALGAAFLSSMIGGIIGAVTLLAAIPIAKPFVLALGSPELLMMALLGLMTVAIVSTGNTIFGILAGMLGLAASSVGTATVAFENRFTFGVLELQDGLSLVVLAVGLFGVPEMLQLLTQKTSVSEQNDQGLTNYWLKEGAKDAIQNLPVVIRGGFLGSVLGMIPAVGGSVASWLAWSTAALSKKNKVPFGQGEIRGVIAPESANNAVDGGNLVPTLLFGIPGSGSMAILLSGLMLMGVQTGQSMLEGEGLVLLLSIILALCLANIFATAACFGVARWMARLSYLPGTVIVPLLVVTLTLAVYQDSTWMGWIFATLAVGGLGWIMMNLGIPRVPVLIGFVLGPSVERYLWISISRYGTDWIFFPKVLAIGAIMLLFAAFSVALARRSNKQVRLHEGMPVADTDRFKPLSWFGTCGVLFLLFTLMAQEAQSFEETASWFPLYTAVAGIAGVLVAIVVGVVKTVTRRVGPTNAGQDAVTEGKAVEVQPSSVDQVLDIAAQASTPIAATAVAESPTIERERTGVPLLLQGLAWLAVWAGFVCAAQVLGYLVASVAWVLLWFQFVHRIRLLMAVAATISTLLLIVLADGPLGLYLPGGEGMLGLGSIGF